MCLTSSPNCLCTSITGKISMAPTPLLAKGNGTLARKWRKIKKRCSSFSSGDSLSRSKSEDRSSHCAANGLSNFSLSHSHKVSDVECSTDDLRTHSRDHSVSILLDFIICMVEIKSGNAVRVSPRGIHCQGQKVEIFSATVLQTGSAILA